MGFVSNAPYLYAWAEKIGQFIVNFGGIEILTYQYLAKLEQSREAFDKNFDRGLADRIDRITELLPTFHGLGTDERASAASMWVQVRNLIQWRNRIAHNPVLPEWSAHKSRNVDPPDRIGLPDVRAFREGSAGDFLPVEALGQMVVLSADLSRGLHAVIHKVESEA